MAQRLLTLLIVPFIALGCQSVGIAPSGTVTPATPTRSAERSGPSANPHADANPKKDSGRSFEGNSRGSSGEIFGGEVLAYVGGRAVRSGEVWPSLVEAAGGEVLGEVVLGRLLDRRLQQAGLEVTDAAIAAERAIVSRTLADDPDQAARLLNELRQRRGLGTHRFAALLRRNAGLRMLIADRITVTDAAVAQAYRLRYGPSSRVRLIVTPSLQQAQRLRQRAAEGQAFGELAALHSTDPSAAQGGLLSPIRPDDTSYPSAMRSALARLDVGQVSPPIALDGGFALIQLEEKIAGLAVELDDVKEALAHDVRRRAERVLMQQVARELLSAAEVVVLDPALKALWETQQQNLLRPQ